MRPPQPRHLTGIDALRAATTLLQRARAMDATAGLYEAADLQWWWRTPRPTDEVPQLFWFDHLGDPEAAVILTQWRDRVAIDPLVMPDAAPDWLDRVVTRGLTHARSLGFSDLSLEIDRGDLVRRQLFERHGFTQGDEGVVEAWMDAPARPPVSRLHAGYRLTSRAADLTRPHHMIGRSGPDVEPRLRQTSLYRPDLDLVVLDAHGEPAAYGLFWHDPATCTGMVEPMRTEDAHQRRGLARHVLTAGLQLLADAGAVRIKICYEPANPAASSLYLDVGLYPVARTDMFSTGP